MPVFCGRPPESAADDLVDIVRQRIDHDLLTLVMGLYRTAGHHTMRHALVCAEALTSPIIDDAITGFDPEMWRCHLTVQLYLPHHHPVRNALLGQTSDDQT